jgi:hypothetical protein
MLTLLLLVASHCFQLSDCAKSSSSPPWEKAAVFPSAQHHDAEDDAHLPSMERPMVGDVVEKTNDAAVRAAPSSDVTTPVQQGKEEEGVGSGPWQQQRTGALRTALLLPSRLPRRFLAAAAGVEESGTDGAGLSCHSHDVHINCPPPSKR